MKRFRTGVMEETVVNELLDGGSTPPASTNGEPGEPGTAIYFVGPVFILALPLPRRR